MSEISYPFPVLEFGSTYIRLAIFDKKIINQNLFYEKRVDFTRNINFELDNIISGLIIKAENDLGQHLNEILLMIDSSSIHSLDLSIKKIYDKKIISNNDINYLINECEKDVKFHNEEKEILQILKYNILLDDNIIKDLENISQEASKAIVELKFILINKNVCNFLKKLFLKKHITISNIFCISYIKCLGLIKKLEISGYSSFIDIGLKKSSLTIFKDNKLIYLNNTHIGGDHLTRDISKILKVDYRTAEARKLKFYKNNKLNNVLSENDLLKKIINSRVEEIIEILFLNCPFINTGVFGSGLKLFLVGNGSRVLNENLLSFGEEFNFISEMSIIDENNKDCCKSAMIFNTINQKIKPQIQSINIENKGFFEKFFGYFSSN